MGWLKKIGGVVMAGWMLAMPVMCSGTVLAVAAGEGGSHDPAGSEIKTETDSEATGGQSDESTSSGPETNILPSDMDIMGLLKLVVSVLVYGLGVVAVLGIVIAGIQYMTARDSEAQVAAAKQRLYNVVIGLIAWAVMFAVLNWLIPGGVNFS